MKNKITKLSLILLLSSFAVNAQTEAQRKSIVAKSNIENSNKAQKRLEQEETVNYSLAVQKATRESMPIEGFNEDGSFFALMGMDKETGKLIYYKTTNNVPKGSSLQTANAKPLHSLDVKGQKMIVGVWDGGRPYVDHDALYGRIVIKETGMPSTVSDHATHVTGTIAAAATGGTGDQMLGFAPEAIVWSSGYNWGNSFDEMRSRAKEGLIVSNHSYGLDSSRAEGYIPGAYGRYNANSRELDLITNDFPKYTIVFAAGNDRDSYNLYNPSKGGRDLLSHEGVSKNAIVVAATKGTEDYSGITGPNSVSNFLTDFSNWGPTDDYRIKPDISAKGYLVLSVGKSSPLDMKLMSGTSMAAPAVTGVVTLWQQYFNQIFGGWMNSATVRAIMAHSAKEAGEAEGPDYKFGWGLIDADAGAQIMREKTQDLAVLAELKMEQGKELNYTFNYDGKHPLIATIAWNDPAGAATTLTDFDDPVLVNDLDLKVINLDTNQEFFPWRLVGGWNTSGANIAEKGVNHVDNIERVNVNNAPAGNYAVKVTYKGSIRGGEQEFSIVISGAGTTMPELGNLSNKELLFNKLNVYPNPAQDVLTISGERNELIGADCQIYDLTGKKVLAKKNMFKNNDGVESLDVSFLPNGVYLLDISNNEHRQVVKFVKK